MCVPFGNQPAENCSRFFASHLFGLGDRIRSNGDVFFLATSGLPISIHMQSKLNDLTERIYQEGVVKAQIQAGVVLANARSDAEAIIAKAHHDAEAIVLRAQQTASESQLKFESELKMAAVQSVAAVKQQIADLVTAKVVNPAVAQLFSNLTFLQSLLYTLVTGFAQRGELDLAVILPESMREQMEQFFKNSLANELNQGLTVGFSKQMGNGFKIGPNNNSYVIGFTDDDFSVFFKSYLKPQTAQFLFESK
jgi:V/A-type H+-transporting ATPase subunit E